MSMRPAILDDGSGGRIVGWESGDLAMAELAPWDPARPESTRAVASRGAMPQPAAPAAPTKPAWQVETRDRSEIAQSPPAATKPEVVAVAPEPTVDEDDWEWTIALARARADAEDPGGAPSPSPPDLTPKATAPAVPAAPVAPAPPRAARTRPMAVVAMKDPASSGEWPKTATIGSIDYAEAARITTRQMPVPVPAEAPKAPEGVRQVREVRTATPSRAASPAPQPQRLPRAAMPATVIPVPTLPTVEGTMRAGRLEPVVRPAAVRVSPRRFPKGTGPVGSHATSRAAEVAAEMSDDTDPTVRLDDRTKPGIALPPAARAVTLPSIKRRGALR